LWYYDSTLNNFSFIFKTSQKVTKKEKNH